MSIVTAVSTPESTWLPQPDLAEVELGTVLQALADPIRLRIVRELARCEEASCSSLDVGVKASTVSHHMHILRESGITSTRLNGNARPSRLRREDMQRRFPGLLDAIISAT